MKKELPFTLISLVIVIGICIWGCRSVPERGENTDSAVSAEGAGTVSAARTESTDGAVSAESVSTGGTVSAESVGTTSAAHTGHGDRMESAEGMGNKDQVKPAETLTAGENSTASAERITPAHVHHWVPVTVSLHRDAVTHTVHHDAITETVHHDAVTHEEPVYAYRTICGTCGADITGQIPEHIGPVCQGACSTEQVQIGVNVVTDQEACDEEVIVAEARDEIVVDQAACEEVIMTGYRCSLCGATKDA